MKQKSSKRIRPYNFVIRVPIYFTELDVVVGTSSICLPYIQHKYGVDEATMDSIKDKGYAGVTIPLQGGVLIWLCEDDMKYRTNNLKTNSVIAHELIHTIGLIFGYVGLKHSEDTEEAFAYLHTWLFQQVSEKLEKRNGR